MSPPRLIFLFGPAASGKLTVAKELAALTGLSLFHNHLTVDLLLSLFPFGSAPFVAHRERIWLELMGAAVADGTSLIFTFNPERTVDPDFPRRLADVVQRAGGRVSFVQVRCTEAVVEQRMEAASRRQGRKLASLPLYQELRAVGAFDFPSIAADFEIETTTTPPAEAAARVAMALGLASAQMVTETDGNSGG